MTQADLNRAVAEATGESVREIARRGFGLLTPDPIDAEPVIVKAGDHRRSRHRPDAVFTALHFPGAALAQATGVRTVGRG